MMSRKYWVATALATVCAAALWAQGLVVCKACGKEAKPGATVCAHCSAQLPVQKAAEPAAAEPPAEPAGAKDAEIGRAAAAVVEGRGERVTPIPARDDLPGVLIWPGVHSSTAEAYGRLFTELIAEGIPAHVAEGIVRESAIADIRESGFSVKEVAA